MTQDLLGGIDFSQYGGIDLNSLGIPGANTGFSGLGLPDNLMASLNT
jgi:hypothetical protein